MLTKAYLSNFYVTFDILKLFFMNNTISAFSGNNLLRLKGASEKIQHFLQLKMADSLVLADLINFRLNVLRAQIVYFPPFSNL